MDYAIRAEGLRKRYGGHEALTGVDLAVPAGTVLGVLGPNGAGKTTTVRTLATLLRPDSGRAEVAGFDVLAEPRQVRKRIGLAGQYAAVDELLTGRENLVLLGTLLRLGGKRAKVRAGELLTRFELTDAADRPVGTYSGGMRRRLDLATCLIADPPVVFLDEPTTGLDPASRVLLWKMVREQVAAGTTVLLTTQYLEEADQLADSIVVIDAGRVIAEGTPDELKRKVGEEWLEIVVSGPEQLRPALAALAPVAVGEPVGLPERNTVTAQLPAGMDAVAAAAAALHASGVTVVDFALRRPSLDDVFFSLTGQPTGKSGTP
jgi:ABC-2 type transport system ATP-binding protein